MTARISGSRPHLRARLTCLAATTLAAVGFAADAHAYQTRTTPGGAPVHWDQPSVLFEVDPALEAAIPGATTATAAAVGAWVQVASDLPALQAVTAEATREPANDGHNVVYFAKDGDPRCGGALAVTILSFDASTGRVVDSDIVVNGRHTFAVLPDGATAPDGATPVSTEGDSPVYGSHFTFDYGHVIAHEAGHALGLRDEPADSEAVMYPYTIPGDATRRAPTADDVAGIQSLYGAAGAPSSEGAASAHAGCGGATVAPRGSGQDAAGMGAVLLAGVLCAGARVRRRAAR
jgi:matrixin